MKRKLALLLAIAMLVITLSACGGDSKQDGQPEGNKQQEEKKGEGGDDKGAEDKEGDSDSGLIPADSEVKDWVTSSSQFPETWDYVCTAKNSDSQWLANMVDGLLENDRYGKFVPCLAESWDSNDDKTVWTFHLRPNVKWVTNTGDEFATLTADDFVTGLRHAAEFKSEANSILQGMVKGYSEYLGSDFSDEAFEKVGVKALDELTVEYTLEKPIPYFFTITTYSILNPINREFLEGKGEGCALGKPDDDKCDFGSLKLDSILYNGGFILESHDDKSQMTFKKNPDYWDAEHIYLDSAKIIYDDGQDPYSSIKGFENGTYSKAALRTSWEDYETYLEKYKDNVYFDRANSTVFGIIWNFNRKTFKETNYASDKALRENTRKAVLNENFRKAMRAANDTLAKLSTIAPEGVAKAMLRSVNNFPAAGTTSDGTVYYDLVSQEYEKLTGEKLNFNDGEQPFLSKEKTLEYIEKAKAEGIQFPENVAMLDDETSDARTKEAQSMKTSVDENSDGQIIIELVKRSQDTVESIAYRESDPAKMDYDISTFSGWGPDYMDPKTFVDIYSPTTGYYMGPCGLGTVDSKGEILEKEIKETVGLMEYEKLYREADEIVDDLDARYRAFAACDAKLLEKCIFIPQQMQRRSQVISKTVPFSIPYSDAGNSEYKWKGLVILKNIITTKMRDAIYQDFINHQ